MNRRGFLKNLLAGVVVSVPLFSAIEIANDEIIEVKNDDLVGYKGKQLIDAGYFYCPYIPLMSSGVVISAMGEEKVSSFITRYGKLNNEDLV